MKTKTINSRDFAAIGVGVDEQEQNLVKYLLRG